MHLLNVTLASCVFSMARVCIHPDEKIWLFFFFTQLNHCKVKGNSSAVRGGTIKTPANEILHGG